MDENEKRLDLLSALEKLKAQPDEEPIRDYFTEALNAVTDADVLRTVTAELAGIPTAALAKVRRDNQALQVRAVHDKQASAARDVTRELDGATDTADYLERVKAAAKRIENLERGDWRAARVERIGRRTFADLSADLKNTPEGLVTGYAELDELITLPAAALTVIGGRPSHGKSALLQNIFRNAVYREDSAFLFCSYEVDWRQVYIRFLQMESGAILNEKQNYRAFLNYLREGKTDNTYIETAKRTLDELIAAGRLIVLDESYFVDELAAVVHTLNDRTPLGGVFVDYLQLVKPRDTRPTRQVQLQVIMAQLRELAKGTGIPIVTAAQVGRAAETRDGRMPKLEDVRESGDIEQEADVVIGVHNPAAPGGSENGADGVSLDTKLELKVLKNRNGLVNQVAKLNYNGATQRITDIRKDAYGGIESE
jgi:replicative DNA helicase